MVGLDGVRVRSPHGGRRRPVVRWGVTRPREDATAPQNQGVVGGESLVAELPRGPNVRVAPEPGASVFGCGLVPSPSTTRPQVIEVSTAVRGELWCLRADRASPEVVAPAASVGAERQRRLASAAARRSYRAHCEPPPPQGRSSFVPPRTTRRQPCGSPIPQSLPQRCRTRCPQRGAQHPSQPRQPQWSGWHRQAARSRPSQYLTQRRRQHACDPLLFVGCWVAHRDTRYNYSTSRRGSPGRH